MRIACSRARRPHVVGTVEATDAGPLLRLTLRVSTPNGPTGAPWTVAAGDPDAAAGVTAWCAGCGKALADVHPDALIRRAVAGQRFVTLYTEGYADDAPGVLRRRAQRRG